MIARDVGGDSLQKPGTVPGDPAALRGLPMIGVRGGHGGAIKGTQPAADVARSDVNPGCHLGITVCAFPARLTTPDPHR